MYWDHPTRFGSRDPQPLEPLVREESDTDDVVQISDNLNPFLYGSLWEYLTVTCLYKKVLGLHTPVWDDDQTT